MDEIRSHLWRLNSNDFVRGAITAVIAGIVMAIYGVVSTPSFDVFAADWNGIFHLAINGAVGAFIGYVGKNLVSDDTGRVFGKIG